MNTVITQPANNFSFYPDFIKSMFKLRDRVFRGRLGWDVTSVDGKEKDEYDDMNPVYMLSCNEKKQVEGCWRILPTTGPYMLRDVFPELLRGERLPEDDNIWELSRLAVDPRQNLPRRKNFVPPVQDHGAFHVNQVAVKPYHGMAGQRERTSAESLAKNLSPLTQLLADGGHLYIAAVGDTDR